VLFSEGQNFAILFFDIKFDSALENDFFDDWFDFSLRNNIIKM